MSKKKTTLTQPAPRSGLLVFLFVLLPFLPLVPQVFAPAFFLMLHLPTKELAYVATAFVFAAAAVVKFFRRPDWLALPRCRAASGG